MKNKIALKLSLYFAVALLAFSVIIGSVFMAIFKNHTVEIHKTELSDRAEKIASTVSEYMDINNSQGSGHGNGQSGSQGSGYGAYFRFIQDIAGADVWIVDENLNLITAGQGMSTKQTVYADLPENADKLVQEVFTDKTVFSEDFSSLLTQPALTVGVPIKSNDEIIGVVLLHSSIHGINEAVTEGRKTLIISIVIALFLAFLLSLWLSKKFTQPIISKEAEDALRLEKIRRDFVANISHELKTPITVMRGSLEALVEEIVSDPETVKEYHKQMLSETLFLQRLVGDLLDLSKLQNTDFAIEKQELSMCYLFDDVVRSVTPLADKKKISINAKTDGNCKMQGDYGRLRQMLMIVIDNAIKFSPENSNIEIEMKNKILTIKDYGVGIPQEELPNIFERFYKSRSEQNKTGTGLGLAIAKQIADRHDIILTVKSEVGKGTEFVFKIPQ
ncbi:MAG TPA: two-component sensor histidine kinase [Clostridiales bacterium]|nr:two-component sensor histidine kinase [Clostridiales bacterium]